MDKEKANALANAFLDTIEPDLKALRQELLEHGYRLNLFTDRTGMFDFTIYTVNKVQTKAKQSRKA